MTLRIYATGKDGIEFEIIDLYWFEENGVHDFGGEAFYDQYKFRFVDDKMKSMLEKFAPEYESEMMNDEGYCKYCGGDLLNGHSLMDHKPDCPYIEAHKLLEELK
jgi:hypothetical protein